MGSNFTFTDGRYGIDYSFKVTATDAQGNLQTVLDIVQPAQGGTDISNLASGLLATAIIPQGFDLGSVQAQFNVAVVTLVPPTTVNHGNADGSWAIGVTDVILRPTAAVPESSTAALMLIGLCGLAAAKRTRLRR